MLNGCNTMEETPPCVVGQWLGTTAIHAGCITEFGLTINVDNTGILQYYPCPDTCVDGASWLESTNFLYYFINDTNMVKINTQERTCNEDWTNLTGADADTIYISCEGNHLQFGNDLYFIRQ
jgi:hypothetical protein